MESESILDMINEMAGDEQLASLENRGESIDLETIKEPGRFQPGQAPGEHGAAGGHPQPGASDIHFEPFENEFKMRYRIDSLLYEMVPPPKSSRGGDRLPIKVMSNLDIAERRFRRTGASRLVVNGAPGGPARSSPADDVRRERGHARAGPQPRSAWTSRNLACVRTTCASFASS